MYAVIEIPFFPFQAWLRQSMETLADAPTVLLDAEDVLPKKKGKARREQGKLPVIGLNPAAEREGVALGMSASQAQARCHKLQLLERSLAAEAKAQEFLLAVAESVSPDFEATRPGVATLNLLGLSAETRLKLAQAALDQLAATGLRAYIGLARNPDLAALAAELASPSAPIQMVEGTPEAVRAFLEPLPITALHPDAKLAEVLRLWGIRQVRDYLALPVAEISQRLGEPGVALWQLAMGGHPRLLQLVRPTAVYAEAHELEYEVELLEQLLFLLRLFLEKILARLASAGRAAGTLRLKLTLRGGGEHKRTFSIPEPCCDVDLLLRVLNTHLETLTTPEPVVAVALEALPARRGKHQPDFFEQELKDPNRFAETLARLEALLGPDRVGRPKVLDSHRPDAFRVVPFLEKNEAPYLPAASQVVALGPPLRRFRPALVARVTLSHDRVPRYLEAGSHRGRIREVRGPWLISGEWWDRETWARQEWDIQLESGRMYRLAYEPHGKTWTLEGTYG